MSVTFAIVKCWFMHYLYIPVWSAIIILMYDNFKVLYCVGNMSIQDANVFICDPGAQKQSKVAGVYL